MDYDGGEFGNAVLVNLSRSDLSYKDSRIQRRKYKRIAGPEDRSALAIRVDMKMPQGHDRDYKNLWFVTTHFPLEFSDWMPQLCKMLVWARGFNFPVLICGDLNVPERRDGNLTTEYQLMNDIFAKEGYVDLGPHGENNFTFARAATKRIDFMYLLDKRKWFTNEDTELIRPKVGNAWVSDHWMVTCTLSYT